MAITACFNSDRLEEGRDNEMAMLRSNGDRAQAHDAGHLPDFFSLPLAISWAPVDEGWKGKLFAPARKTEVLPRRKAEI